MSNLTAPDDAPSQRHRSPAIASPDAAIPDQSEALDSSLDTQPDEGIRVFVYGTLKPGECNYARYCDGQVTDQFEAIAYGTLYHLPVGYPAMTVGDRPIQGVVLCLRDPSTLNALDMLEDYDPNRSPDKNEYNRITIDVFDAQGNSQGTVWAYIMDAAHVMQRGGVPLPDGVWQS